MIQQKCQMIQSILIMSLIVLLFAIIYASPAHINNFKHHMRTHKRASDDFIKNEYDQYKRTLPPSIWTLLAENSVRMLNQTNDSMNIDNDTQNEINNNMNPKHFGDDESIQTSSKCPKCSINSVEMSETELNNLRIEYVKNQILHKLEMSGRPPKNSFNDLPKPVQDGFAVQNHKDIDFFDRHLDDYFAKTTQKIIFLTREFEKCKPLDYPSLCFTFQAQSNLDIGTVESMDLWIYKFPTKSNVEMNHTLLLSQLEFQAIGNKFIKSKLLAVSELKFNTHKWEKINLTKHVKGWIENHNHVRISCKSCDHMIPISLHPNYKPFIVINTLPKINLNRKRRDVDCGLDSTECCRDSLYIDFVTMGWSDWIIHPKGYNAYFCQGSCNRLASITQSVAHHSTIFNIFLHHSPIHIQKKLELVPCCTATRYSSLSMIFLDSNKTATHVTLPNMIVESCGCS